jgi:pimeloyl-ACP methyl ester carboxylesterase
MSNVPTCDRSSRATVLGRDVSLSLRLASLPYVVEQFGQPFMASGTRFALNAAGGAYEAHEIARLASMNATAGTARAFARSVRDVIDWRGQHRHLRDGGSDVSRLPPVALFWGECDSVIPLTHALETTALLGGAAVTRFPNCGHFPHRQAPLDFARALEGFLDRPVSPVGQSLAAA